MAPVLLGVLAVLSFILPALVVGAVAGIGTFFFTSALPAAGIAAFLGFVGASILKGIFGSLGRTPLGGRNTYRVAGLTEVANESLDETRVDDSRRRQACAA